MGLIFVYGTLKTGGENNRLVAGQKFLGPARTEPIYRLYDLDGYPGMVEAGAAEGGKAIEGEVWDVDEDCLQRLDVLEGVKISLYHRAPVRLQAPFAGKDVETYLYLRSVQGCPELGTSYDRPAPPDQHTPIGAKPRRPANLGGPGPAPVPLSPTTETDDEEPGEDPATD